MILIFRNFFKCDLKNLYESFLSTIQLHQHKCPFCNASCSFVWNGHYLRHCITIINSDILDTPFDVHRVKCKECKHTHALLPDILIPYQTYSYPIIICILSEYYLTSITIEQLCEKYMISHQNFYRWKQTYNKQKILGALVAQIQSNKDESLWRYISKLENISNFLKCFFIEHQVVFLHNPTVYENRKIEAYHHHTIFELQ